MIKGYYRMLAKFFNQHVRNDDGSPIRPDPVQIHDAIQFLLDDGWTRRRIQQEALLKCDVIIRDDLFPMEVHEHD